MKRRLLLFHPGTELWGQLVHSLQSRQEFEVRTARSLDQLMAEWAAFAPQLIVADVDAPGGGRWELLDKLAGRPGAPPVAIVTAADSAELAVEALRRGAADYILLNQQRLNQVPGRLLALLEAADSESPERPERIFAGVNPYELHFRDAPDMMHVVDRKGRIVEANPAELKTLGYSAEQYLGKPFLEVVHPACRPAVRNALEAVIRGRPVESLEATLVTKTGQWRDVDMTVFPAREGGEVVAARAIMRDITQRKAEQRKKERLHAEHLRQQQVAAARAQAELDRAMAELVTKTRLATLGQLSASIAHELRNPLGSIRNAVFYLKRHLPAESGRLRTFLEIIEEETRKADLIIGNLLGMARAKKPRAVAVDLGQLVKDVFNQSCRRPGIRCKVRANPEPFIVRADPDQLRQVVENLVQNAAEAMGQDGELVVEATRTAEYDTILFRDTGPGIAASMQPHLFEPLATDKAEGTGLGLAICRQIVESHGGTIELVPAAKAGAAFRIRLPRETQGRTE